MDAYQGKVKDKHVIHRHRPHTHSEGIASQESVLDSFGELSVSFVTHSLLLLKMFLPRPVKKLKITRIRSDWENTFEECHLTTFRVQTFSCSDRVVVGVHCILNHVLTELRSLRFLPLSGGETGVSSIRR